MKTLDTNYLKVRMSPRDFILQEEQEQRNDTIIGALGTIAAYYGTIVFIYVFLFGVESMRPWGVIHNGCCGLRKFKSDPEKILALASSPDSETDIEQRIRVLEEFKEFLKDNVVEITLLDRGDGGGGSSVRSIRSMISIRKQKKQQQSQQQQQQS
ncbi:hypothetical protein C1645_764137 [Glomus cerebriforme]|uniref:Uncharacterized protein n=1 Tax=Glomus cerebriforme TaxID=658196 RepID=A0A397TCX1_9GLOM|nr:hypothetical protein C1645_764137 [Glomus cerebriforme]